MKKVVENHNLRIRVLYRPPEQTLEAVKLQGFLFLVRTYLKRQYDKNTTHPGEGGCDLEEKIDAIRKKKDAGWKDFYPASCR